LDLVKFWLPTIKETKKLFGRDLRRLIEQIYIILKTHNFLADEQLEALSIKIAELNPDSEAESFISSVFKSNHPIEIIDLLLELKKQYLLDLAIEQAVNTTKNVVAEMNVLAENQISTIEFEIFNLYDSLVNSPTINELKEQNISYSLLIDKGKIIRFDKISFAQIVSLLIQNAIESFDQNQSMRKIEITCSQNDDYEIISFRNNGIEIQPENIHRIFDRFFTTKSRKLHRGLGLSTVKSIIEGYGGKIVVNSNKEITTFDLYIKKMT
jgi:signal transduction histidine kinase